MAFFVWINLLTLAVLPSSPGTSSTLYPLPSEFVLFNFLLFFFLSQQKSHRTRSKKVCVFAIVDAKRVRGRGRWRDGKRGQGRGAERNWSKSFKHEWSSLKTDQISFGREQCKQDKRGGAARGGQWGVGFKGKEKGWEMKRKKTHCDRKVREKEDADVSDNFTLSFYLSLCLSICTLLSRHVWQCPVWSCERDLIQFRTRPCPFYKWWHFLIFVSLLQPYKNKSIGTRTTRTQRTTRTTGMEGDYKHLIHNGSLGSVNGARL